MRVILTRSDFPKHQRNASVQKLSELGVFWRATTEAHLVEFHDDDGAVWVWKDRTPGSKQFYKREVK